MKLMIRRIVLWPRDKAFEPRIIRFRIDKVNIITGRSRTGKSAITSIIDYCLGSSRCAIPVGYARDTVDWYGILIETESGLIRISRAHPTTDGASPDFHIAFGRDAISYFVRPAPNTTIDGVKSTLGNMAGLSSTPIDSAHDERQIQIFGTVSFRDLTSFCFLPQHIVANPYTLFYRADTVQRREKLKAIFPFVIGAIDINYLSVKDKLAAIKRAGLELRAERDQRNKIVSRWKAEVSAYFTRAIELGLLVDQPVPSEVSSCVDILRELPGQLDVIVARSMVGGQAAGAKAREKLKNAEARAANRVASIKRRVRNLTNLKDAVGEFSATISEFSPRTKGAGWFRQLVVDQTQCPVCGEANTRAREVLDGLKGPLEEVAEFVRASKVAPPELANELGGIEAELRDAEEELLTIRRQRKELEERLSADDGSPQLEDVYRYIGNLERALTDIEIVEGGDGIEDRLAELRREYKEASGGIDEKARREKEEATHKIISRNISRYAEALDAEKFGSNPHVDLVEMNIAFFGKGGKSYLWQVGSGANWMAYHLACMIALHEHFLSLSHNPVPSFLVIDQPSQVFFPKDTYENLKEAGSLEKGDDVVLTKRIFEVLGDAFRRLGHHLQIIVTEHADRSIWGDDTDIVGVENWHGADADYLIPKAWTV